MDSLKQSILDLAGYEVFSEWGATIFLDLDNARVVPWRETGSYPRAFVEGRWLRLCRVPARAVSESLVAKLLEKADELERIICQYQEGEGIPEIEEVVDPDSIQTFWEPQDWFEPVLNDLKRYFRLGLTPEQALEKEKASLETPEARVSLAETLNFFRQLWEEWAEEEVA